MEEETTYPYFDFYLREEKKLQSDVVGKTIITDQYYIPFFEKLNNFRNNIPPSPAALRLESTLKFKMYTRKEYLRQLPTKDKHVPLYILTYPIYLISLLIHHFKMKMTPKFDVNRYLEVFDLIKVDKGFVLDYEYIGDAPSVYTRKKSLLDTFKLKTDKLRNTAFGLKGNIENISFEKSPEGFFQFAVFSIVIHQFYLFWHACYNDDEIVYSRSQIDEILKEIIKEELRRNISRKRTTYMSSDEQDRQAEHELEILFSNKKSDDDITPYLGPLIEEKIHDPETKEIRIMRYHWTKEETLIEFFNSSLNPEIINMDNGYTLVKMMFFSKWFGFHYKHIYIQYPNMVKEFHGERVLPYDCGIEF